MDTLQRKIESRFGINFGVTRSSAGATKVQHQQAPHPVPRGLESATCPATGFRSRGNHQMPTEALDLTDIRAAIHAVMYDPSHDDGSYAPLLIRFAWHLSGTFDKESNTGGSNGSTMRFEAEANDPENAGFDKAKALLVPIQEQFPWLSLADLWILAGYVAIEATGGPRLRFSHGRKDFTREEAVAIYGVSCCPFGDGKFNPHGSRLPAADLGPDKSVPESASMCEREAPTINAIRSTFSRMGFDDGATVALILLGHQFGRCHQEVSGYEGAWWARTPADWNADGIGFLYCAAVYDWEYEENPCMAAHPINPSKHWPHSNPLAPEHRLNRTSWTRAVRPHPILAEGKRQYDNTGRGRHIMMLIADMCLTWDPKYRQHLYRYRHDREAFRLDAIAAWKQLTELGCDGLLIEELTPL